MFKEWEKEQILKQRTLYCLYKENEYTLVNTRKYLEKIYTKPYLVANSGEWGSGEETRIFTFWSVCVYTYISNCKKIVY